MSNTNDSTQELRGVLVRWAMLILLFGLFAMWATCRMNQAAERLAAGGGATAATKNPEPTIEYWTCTMHPDVRQDEAGDCPICGMELVAKYEGASEPGVKPTMSNASGSMKHAQTDESAAKQKKKWYRCTMPECGDQGSDDPNSRCPVCGMKREDVSGDAESEDVGEYEITLSERARRLADVETVAAEPRLLKKRIRTVGRATYDETRFKMVSAWIGGRIDKLFADFTGMSVNEGDHLVDLYSPDLLAAQEEYLQAYRNAVNSNMQSSVMQRSNQQVLGSARRKLELLGITANQIAAIERSNEPRTRLVVYAPIGGTIVKKQAMEGMYVKTGDPLYSIADLTHLWLLVDLYESDLPWVKPFQEVRLTTQSLPGDVFSGQIVFVDPRVDPATRTVAVRMHVDNPDLRLKPDMWLTAEIDAGLAAGGKGAVPAPKGDYACPMHTWAAENEPGACAICGMKLVKVEDLPQYAPPTDSAPILAVPRGAVMQTGTRALVYVESAAGRYRGVEVTTGPLAHDDDGNDWYPILGGLNGGEAVVVRGNFAIDSQMQLAGKPSLFSTRGFANDSAAGVVDRQGSEASSVRDEAGGDVAQTICPVMEGEIDPEVFIEYKGAKIYFCCWGCDKQFVEAPSKYLAKLPLSIQKIIRSNSASEAGND